MRILAIALKDLQQIARDRKSAIFLVLMPILFTLFFGFAFSASASDPRLPVGWINQQPGEPFSASLRQMVEQSETIRLLAMEEKDIERAETMVRDQKLAAAIIVPVGVGAITEDGQAIKPTLVVLPGTAAGQTAATAVQSIVKRNLGAIEIARISADTLRAQLGAVTGDEYDAIAQQALTMANAAWQEPALGVNREPALKAETAEPETPKGFVQSSPGMIVMFSVFGLVTWAMVLVVERKSRTLQRMLTTPTHRAEIIAGHTLAMWGVGFLQTLMLVALGQFAFGVNYLREPAGTLLLTVVLALWSASLGLLIGSISSTEEKVVMFSLIVMFAFSALGGAWFPLEIAGKTFSTVGHLLPTAWAMDGLQNIVLRGLGLNSILLPTGILLAYSVLFFGLALWRFRFE